MDQEMKVSGAHDADMKEHHEDFGHEEYGPMGRMMYRASYGLSYVVVYPFAMLAHMMPKDNAMVHGLTDGAMAARDAVDRLRNGSHQLSHSAEMPALAAQHS
jgi:hypothetical protein